MEADLKYNLDAYCLFSIPVELILARMLPAIKQPVFFVFARRLESIFGT